MSSQLLTLSRAARLVDVARSALQKKIREGEVTTFEGKISITDLLRVYPQAQLEDDSMLELVKEIKAKAKPKRAIQDKSSLPSAEVLAGRLSHLSRELVKTRTELFFYAQCLEAIEQKLQSLKTVETNSNIHLLHTWLVEQLQQQSTVVDRKAQLLVKDTFLRLIAALVKMIPSGHEFFVEGTDSILESSLRAGLTPNYGCTAGNCGACKARLVSGEVLKIRHHDYILSDSEKQMGYFLLCSNTAVTDIVIEAAEAHKTADISSQRIIAEVKKLERFGDDFLILHLQTPQTKTLRFISGQSVKLTIGNISASYPIASCPCDGRYLEFHLRKKAANPFTEFVFNELQSAQTIQIEGPEGDFILEDNAGNPILFIAYEDGFSAIKSLIEHTIALDIAESFYLYRVATHATHFYLNNLCRSWEHALENFEYIELTAQESELEHKIEEGIRNNPQLNQCEVYATGNEQFIKIVEKILLEQGVAKNKLHLAIINDLV